MESADGSPILHELSGLSCGGTSLSEDIPRAILFALAISTTALTYARAEPYSDKAQFSSQSMAQFAQSICGDVAKGSVTRISIQGALKANAGRLAKIVSGDANVSGSRTEVIYRGVPFDKLPDNIPTESQCKLELMKLFLGTPNPMVQDPLFIYGNKEVTRVLGPVTAGHNIVVCVQRIGPDYDLADETLVVRLFRNRIVRDEIVDEEVDLAPLNGSCQSDKKVGWGMRARIADTGQYSIVAWGELGNNSAVGAFDYYIGRPMRWMANKFFGLPYHRNRYTLEIKVE